MKYVYLCLSLLIATHVMAVDMPLTYIGGGVYQPTYTYLGGGVYQVSYSTTPASTTDLVLQYLMGANGSESTITLDTSGNNYTGTVVNMVYNFPTNGLSAYYEGDGSGDYILAYTNCWTELGTSNKTFTISTWINVDTVTGNDGVWDIGTTFANDFGATKSHINASTLYWNCYQPESGYARNASINYGATNIGVWRNISYVWDCPNSNMSIYVDGIVSASEPINPELDYFNIPGGTLMIVGGYYATGNTLDGRMHRFDFYTNALTASEILATNIQQSAQLGITSQYLADNLTSWSNCVLNWTANNIIQDGSKEHIEMTTASAPTAVPVKVGNGAYDFNGSANLVIAPYNSVMAGLTNGLTACFWVKSDSANPAAWAYALGQWDYADNQRTWVVEIDDALNQWVLYTSDTGAFVSGSYVSSQSAPSTNWQHLAVTMNNATRAVYWYVNGQHTYSNLVTKSFINVSSDITIGGLNAALYFDGKLDEIMVFQGVKTPAQISEIYNSQTNLFF